jgi:alcohol dehydrogenase class IV
MVKHLGNKQLYLGKGSRFEAIGIGSQWGQRCLLVVGAASLEKIGELARIEKELRKTNLDFEVFHITGEPNPELINQIVQRAKEFKPNFVLSIGGGSVLDSGKAIAALFFEEESVTNYLEGVGVSKPSGRTLPHIAIPTTSGTGSEATKNAVISKPGKNGFKKSLRHDNYVPALAIIDPELLITCPLETSIYSGLDAFTQLFESFISVNATALTDMYASQGLKLFLKYFQTVINNLTSIEARESLGLSSYYSGISLANAGLGTLHGLAGSLGGIISEAHGAICAKLIPSVYEFQVGYLLDNVSGLKKEPGTALSKMLKKYIILGQLFRRHFFRRPEKHFRKDLYHDEGLLKETLNQVLEGIQILKNMLPDPGFKLPQGFKGPSDSIFIDLAENSSDKNSPLKTDVSQRLSFIQSIFS